MTKQRAIEILQGYVDNDYAATSDSGYIRDTLLAVADEYEIRELGFGWALDGDDDNDEYWN